MIRSIGLVALLSLTPTIAWGTPTIVESPAITVASPGGCAVLEARVHGATSLEWRMGGRVVSTKDVLILPSVNENSVVTLRAHDAEGWTQVSTWLLVADGVFGSLLGVTHGNMPTTSVAQGQDMTLTAPQGLARWYDPHGGFVGESRTLTMRQVSAASAGSFYARTYQYSPLLGAISTCASGLLRVQRPPTWTTKLEDRRVPTGTTVVLEAPVSGDELRYIWRASGEVLGRSRALAWKPSRSDKVTLEVANDVGRLTGTVAVEVDESVKETARIVAPNEVTGTLGGALSLAAAWEDPQSREPLTWKRDGKVVAKASKLTFERLGVEHQGTYQVSGAGVRRDVRVRVLEPARVAGTRSPQVRLGDAATLEVRATGSELRYEWRRGAEIVSTQPRYEIPAVSRQDTGSYQVAVWNEVSAPVVRTIRLEAFEAPKITRPPEAARVRPGGRVMFAVEASGDTLSYVWTHGAKVVGRAATLSLDHVEKEQAGTYVVRVTNPMELRGVTATVSLSVEEQAPESVSPSPRRVPSLGATKQSRDPRTPRTLPGASLSFAPTLPNATFDPVMEVRGRATGGGRVEVTSSRLSDLVLSGTVNASGHFEVAVPLDLGDNALQIQQILPGGKRGRAFKHRIERRAPALPILTLNSPQEGLRTPLDFVSVTGELVTSSEKVRITMGGQTARLEPLDTHHHRYVFDRVSLVPGDNLLRVEVATPAGVAREEVMVRRVELPEQEDEAKAWVRIEATRGPRPGWLQGVVFASDCVKEVTLAGETPRALKGLYSPRATFETWVPLGNKRRVKTLDIRAVGCSGEVARETVQLGLDKQGPRVTFDGVRANAHITTKQSSYLLTGLIEERALAGALLAGKTLVTTPGEKPGTWRFEADLKLSRGVEHEVKIQAWDREGNRTQKTLYLKRNTPVASRFVFPRQGEVVLAKENDTSMPFSVFVDGAGAKDQVWVIAQGPTGERRTRLQPSGGLYRGSIDIGSAIEDARVEVVDPATGDILSSTTTKFQMVEQGATPVELVRIEPANESTGVETNKSITLHFNQEIDPTKLDVLVHETVHGYVYEVPESGADLRSLSNVTRVQRNRTREERPGAWQMLPGNRSFVFYPDEEWSYGATLFVSMTYDGADIGQRTFEVRPIPTLVHGFVGATGGVNLEGVTVELAELGVSTKTDVTGAFTFGWGWEAERRIPNGRYKLRINMDGGLEGFGATESWVVLHEGEINGLGSKLLPILDATQTGALIAAGSQAALAGGNVTLDLSGATSVLFPDGATSGVARASLVHLDGSGLEPGLGVLLGMAFVLEPAGIQTTGNVGFTVSLPQFSGSYDYLDNIYESADIPAMFWLLALEPATLQYQPVGVMRVDKSLKTATLTSPSPIARLDALVLGWMLPQQIPYAASHVLGHTSFAQLLQIVNAQ